MVPLETLGVNAGLSAEKFTDLKTGALAAVAGIGAIVGVAAAAGAALFKLAQKTAEYGSEIFDASEKTGLSAQSLSSLKFAADQSGSSLEAITGATAKFAKTVANAADGSDKAAAKLAKFGIDPQEAINDLDGALAKVFKTIVEAKPGVEQLALAQEAFGRSGADLLPTIKSFDGDMTKLIATAKELGLTLTDEDARAADEFGDQLDTLNTQLAGVGRTIGREVLPVFQELASDLSAFLKENPGAIQAWGQTFAYWLQRVADVALNTKITIEGLQDIYKDFAEGNVFSRSDAFIERRRQRDTQLQEIKNRVAGTDIKGPLRDDGENILFPGSGLGTDGRPAFGTRKPFDGEEEKVKKKAAASRKSDADARTDKQVYQDFVKALKEVGVTINSGFRTFKEQSALFNKLPRGQAARPGTSDHEFYKAVDLPPGVKQDLIQKAAIAAGVVLEKRNVHQGTGLHNHQGFRKGKSERGGGEADLEKELEQERNLAERIAEIKLKFAEDTQRQQFEIERAGNEHLLAEEERLGRQLLEAGRYREAIDQARIVSDIRIGLIRDEVQEQQINSLCLDL